MDEISVPLDKVVIISRIEYLLLNLYDDPIHLTGVGCLTEMTVPGIQR